MVFHGLDIVACNIYNVACNKEVSIITTESRAEYFKKRRESTKSFNVAIDREKMEKFENVLKNKNQTKKEWLEQKIDEEIR